MSQPQATESSTKLEPLGWPLIRLALVVVLGGLAPLLDTTIVNVGLQTLERDFHVTTAAVQWVTTAYLLALAITVPVTTWATARFGARRMQLAGLIIFVIGSVAAGFSWSLGSLIFFRALLGVGAGIIQPLVQTILVRAAGPKKLGRVITIVTLVTLIAPIAGPLVGGAILANFSWSLIFFVNVPFCLAAVILGAIYIPKAQADPARRLDLVGLVMLAPALVGILYSLTTIATNAGDATASGTAITWTVLIASVVLLAAFIVWSLRRGAASLIPLAVFRIRSFASASGVLFFSGLSLYGALFLMPLFFQQVREQGALIAGLLLALQGVGSLATRWVGSVVDRIGARPIAIAGILLCALATIPFAFAGAHSTEVILAISLIVRGGGLSAANIAVAAGAFKNVPREEVPAASAIVRLLQQLGGSLGVAVLAVILVAGAGAGAAHPVAGFQLAFTWSIILSAAALIPAFLLPGKARAEVSAA